MQMVAAAPLSAAIAALVGAGFFAAGFLLGRRRLFLLASNADDDGECDELCESSEDDDDDEKSSSSRLNKSKRKRRAGLRLFSWARNVVTRSDAAREEVAGRQRRQKASLLEIESLAEILEDFKMVLVVRNDLKMGKGKIAAQCSHATLGLFKKLQHRAPKSLSRWESCGQVKVVLKVESEEDMLQLQERAKALKLPTHITIDAGRTQIAPNSRTVMSILGPADIVDDVTGGLKLL